MRRTVARNVIRAGSPVQAWHLSPQAAPPFFKAIEDGALDGPWRPAARQEGELITNSRPRASPGRQHRGLAEGNQPQRTGHPQAPKGRHIMSSVFDVLGKDHREVEHLLGELERRPGVLAAPDANADAGRRKKIEQLIKEVSKHEAAEEMQFWPAVREHLATGEALADQAIAQEQEGKRALDLLDKLDQATPEFDTLLADFIRSAREHISYEETIVWPKLMKALSAQQAADLGQQVTRAKKAAPTRPHPGTPTSPGVLKGVGPVMGAADRLRDSARGRGKH